MTSHGENITTIEWDHTGSKLLIGDCLGNVEVWAVKDHILSQWTQVTSHAAFPGERVLTALWFHPGIKIGVSPDKKYKLLPYQEKFSPIEFRSSVRSFGGRPATGCLAISCSGIVWAMVIQPDNTTLIAAEILGPFRSMIKAIDVCYTESGHFLVVASNGFTDSSINCYKVSVKINNFSNHGKSKCTIASKPFKSFYLTTLITNGMYPIITQLKFVLKEASQGIIAATSGASGSAVELWELVESPTELHQIFKKKTKSDIKEEGEGSKSTEAMDTDGINEMTNGGTREVWQHRASVTYSSPVVSVGTPRLSLFDSVSPPSFVIVSFEDSSIKCFVSENLKEICKLNHPLTASTKCVEGQPKFGQKMQSSIADLNVAKICDLQFTWTGCALVALDTFSQLFVYRVSPITDPTSLYSTPQYAQMVMEYCLMTGIDAWDVVLGLKSHSIEPTCELLTTAFNRQSQALQAKNFTRFHELKGFLYRALPSKNSSSIGQVKAGDAYTTIMLSSVSTFLKSLLRARDNQEKEGPAENLTSVIQTKGTEFVNVDKVLMELEHKEFFVEPFALPSVQNLNQWVADLTLYLLASLPVQVHNHYRFPGGSLINDVKSINLLRELLVVIRIWGLINEFCLPVFTRVSGDDRQLDVIAHLFKLLTKRIQTIGGEPDELLLDECCLLPNQVLISQVDFSLKSRGIASPCLHTIPTPFTCIYFTDPSFLKYSIKTHTIDGAVICNSSKRMDVVRHVSLGPVHLDTWSTSKVRLCTRCFAMSLIPNLFNLRQQPTSRSWEQRFYKSCPCGGYWS